MQLSFHLQFFVSTKDGFRRWHVHVFGEGGNQVYESDISFNFIRDDIFRPAFGIFSKKSSQSVPSAPPRFCAHKSHS